MVTPRLSTRALQKIAAVICGNVVDDHSISPYRTGADIEDFFGHDLRLDPDGVLGGSRAGWTESWLKKYNGTDELRRIIEAAVRPSDYQGSEHRVEDAVGYLNALLAHDDLRLVRSGRGYRLNGPSGTEILAEDDQDVLSTGYVDELTEKCVVRLKDGDLEGAITLARTLLEAVLVAIEEDLTGGHGDDRGDLPKQYKRVSKLLRIDDSRSDLDSSFKEVARGLVMVVNGIAPIRNKMSDGHARVGRPAPHHARAVVNSSMTVTRFLIESHAVQTGRGLLSRAGGAHHVSNESAPGDGDDLDRG